MKANSLKALACGALVAGSMSAEAASVNYYLKLDGIIGGATNKDCKDCKDVIDLQDFTWGVEVTWPDGTSKDGSPGKPVLGGTDFSWTQSLDISVPQILESLGKQFATANLYGVSAGASPGARPFEFFRMDFKGVRLTSFEITASSDDRPSVEGVFEYDSVKMTVIPQKPDGTPGLPVEGTFSARGFGGSPKVFSQIADFSQPILDESPVVPVPAALPLLVSGLGCLAWAGLRRTRSRAGQAA